MAGTPLTDLPNIGPRSAAWLRAIGLDDIEALRSAGSLEAYRRARLAFPDRVSLNLLYPLEAGLRGIPWNRLPARDRDDLRRRAKDRKPASPLTSDEPGEPE